MLSLTLSKLLSAKIGSQILNSNDNKKIPIVLAVLSALFALLGTFILPLSFVAIILGHLALRNLETKDNKMVKIFAKIGLILGYVWLIFSSFAMVYFLWFAH